MPTYKDPTTGEEYCQPPDFSNPSTLQDQARIYAQVASIPESHYFVGIDEGFERGKGIGREECRSTVLFLGALGLVGWLTAIGLAVLHLLTAIWS